jgi:hypothetical protein
MTGSIHPSLKMKFVQFLLILLAFLLLITVGCEKDKPLYVVTSSHTLHPDTIDLPEGVVLAPSFINRVVSAYSMTTDTGYEVTEPSDTFYAEGKVYVPKNGEVHKYRFTIFFEDPAQKSVNVFYEGVALLNPSEGDIEYIPTEPNDKEKAEMIKVMALVSDNLPKIKTNL